MESTMKTYKAGWSKYQKFTSQFHLTPHPITGEKVTLFISYMGAQGLAASTIEVYLAGLRFFRLLADLTCIAPSFHTPYVNLIIRGIKRVNVGKGSARIRLPPHHGHDEPYQSSPCLGPTQLSESGTVGSLLHRVFWFPTLQRIRGTEFQAI